MNPSQISPEALESRMSGLFKRALAGELTVPDPEPETPEAAAERKRVEAIARRERNDELLVKGGYTKRAVLAAHDATGPAIDKATALLPRILDDGVLLLLGPTGRGKTVMATWLAARRQDQGLKCGKFMTAYAMFSDIKSTFGGHRQTNGLYGPPHAITADSLVEGWSLQPLLVIDEVQTRTESAWEDGMLEEVINARYGAMLPTILIANLSPEDAQKALGPRIMDRANECGGIVNCDWPSYRG